jgi:hypothetical protein
VVVAVAVAVSATEAVVAAVAAQPSVSAEPDPQQVDDRCEPLATLPGCDESTSIRCAGRAMPGRCRFDDAAGPSRFAVDPAVGLQLPVRLPLRPSPARPMRRPQAGATIRLDPTPSSGRQSAAVGESRACRRPSRRSSPNVV